MAMRSRWCSPCGRQEFGKLVCSSCVVEPEEKGSDPASTPGKGVHRGVAHLADEQESRLNRLFRPGGRGGTTAIPSWQKGGGSVVTGRNAQEEIGRESHRRRFIPRSRPQNFRLLGSVMVGAISLAACSSSMSSAGPSTVPAPKGLPAFYAVPQPLPAGSGRLIKD